MSTTNLPGPKLSWFSVVMRYFAPTRSVNCFAMTFTLRAKDGKDAIDRALVLFNAGFFDPVMGQAYLPEGVLIEPWCFHAIELPPERAAALDQELLAATTKDGATPSDAGEQSNVIELFPGKKDTPPDGSDGGGPGKAPPSSPSGGGKS